MFDFLKVLIIILLAFCLGALIGTKPMQKAWVWFNHQTVEQVVKGVVNQSVDHVKENVKESLEK